MSRHATDSDEEDRGPKEFECDNCGATTYEHGPCVECGLEPYETPDSDEESGLYGKYEVTKNGEAVENCFVLKPESDPAAREALWEYISETDDDELAEDLRSWLLATVGSTEEGDNAE